MTLLAKKAFSMVATGIPACLAVHQRGVSLASRPMDRQECLSLLKVRGVAPGGMGNSSENSRNPSPDRQGGADPAGCLNRSLTVAARFTLEPIKA